MNNILTDDAQRLPIGSELASDNDALRRRIAALEASTSWRITSPLRSLVTMLRRTHSLSPSYNQTEDAMQPEGALRPDVPKVGHPVSLAAKRADAIDIVICVHNALNDVKLCLQSLSAYMLPPYQLILIDDGSDREVSEFLSTYSLQNSARLIRNNVAKGYTLAANQGLLVTSAPWVVLLNSDTVISAHAIERMWQSITAKPRIGIVGPLSNTASWQSIPEVWSSGDWPENLLPHDMSVQDMGHLVSRVSPSGIVDLPFINGFCMMLSQEMLWEIGLFDEVNFAAGYGEENDLCIRAREHGWTLGVAADAYVYHSQSKSYSHERRKSLAARADLTLSQKYDAASQILPDVARCRESLALVSVRARVRDALACREKIMSVRSRCEGAQILFILPSDGASGGARVVVQEALALRQVGVSAAILNFDDLVPEFRANNPGVDLSIFSVHNARDVASFLSDKARKFDAVICTLYASTHWLPTFNIGPNLGYYIQDYEPFFFETGSRDFRLANASYVTRADLRLFCKTEWVAKKVQQLSNSSPQVIGPSVNLALFSPNSSRAIGEPIHIAAMLRPSTPRRAAMRTAGVLVQISKRYGSRVRITTFGASSEQLTDYGIVLPTEIENVGYIKPDGMALLLSSCHIFVDASDFQAMGLTALEAMASGCAVVVPMDGGCKEFATHLENAILVNTGDPQQVEQAIAHLIDDQELLRRIQRNAVMSVAGLGPLGAACRLAEFMLDGKHEN